MKTLVKIYIFSMFFSVPIFADIKVTIEENLPYDSMDIAFDKKQRTNYLYISKAKDISKVETMTYYLDSSPELKDNLFDSFYIFSDKLGLSNGAVYLPTLKGKWKKNRNTNFEYFEKSNCKDKKIFLGNTFIVFEIRKTGVCLPIPITEKQYLELSLQKILKILKSLKKQVII